MTTNSQLSTNEPKRKEKQWKQKLSKQLEQEQNQRNEHHMEGFQGREELGGRGVASEGQPHIDVSLPVFLPSPRSKNI